MKRILYFVMLFGLATVCDAQVVGGLAEVAIIDRDSGATLNPYFYRGEYWVAGRPGARYAIEIRNRLDERLLAVTSVDGVNVVSGATAAWDQAGYVFSGGERYQITGWRKSDVQVAAFTFTASPNSYAERTGRPANVGVIGVAVFRERQPPQYYAPPVIGGLSEHPESRRAQESAAAQPAEPIAQAPMAGAPAPAMPPQAQALDRLSAGSSSMSAAAPQAALRAPAPAPKLGTGHGEREYSYVNHTEFARMQTQPNEVIRIHYDSLDNLMAMGIVKRPRALPPTANPFPASPDQQYVPDPPG
ncbi:MAG TPA: hypothetical protein VMQ54_10280 [Steroidobacteraceae bacterium]|jgi:hypothetical protein|nr:hypothetical protein [Steroidobacteraceae bacterium]